jgi:hypothetical protein
VQHRLEQTIGARFVAPAQSVVQLVDPAVCQLNGVVETFEADGAHTFLPLSIESRIVERSRRGLREIKSGSGPARLTKPWDVVEIGQLAAPASHCARRNML